VLPVPFSSLIIRIMKVINGVEVSDRVAAQLAAAQARVVARRRDREVFRARRDAGLRARHGRKLARPG